jgi:hypothetical protein
MIDESAGKNTDREVWRGSDDGNGSYYADSVHVTKEGGLGINVGGHVIVMNPRDWHRIGVEYLKTLESPYNDPANPRQVHPRL